MASMRLKNFGDIHQFEIVTEEDLARIDDLDPARWAATSAPLKDLQCDDRFLKYLDPDDTGRIRVSQLVAARDWVFDRLSRKDILRTKKEELPLSALATSDDGAKIKAAAERVNREQSASDTTKITLADVRAFKGGYPKLLANGDGVVPPDLLTGDDLQQFVKDVMEVVGKTPDRGGADGIDESLLTKFKTQGAAWLAWNAKSKEAEQWGADTAPAWAMVEGLDAKIEQFFLQGELIRQEQPTAEQLRIADADLKALRFKDLAGLQKHIGDAPLANPNPSGVLDLYGPINTVHADAFKALRDKVILRVLGSGAKTMTRPQWHEVKAAFTGYLAWKKEVPPEPFDKLGADKLRGYLDGALPARTSEAIAIDKAAQVEIDQVDNLERVILSVRWLIELANNFVNFSAIYRPGSQAMVDVGSLVIDGRRLEFCIRVVDRAAHKPVASESLCFLVYAKITEKEGAAAAYEICTPVTGGERGRLRVGKRGIFYDTAGEEWDAQIVDIVENPISVREAAFAPFRRAQRFVSEKIEEWVASKASSQSDALQAQTASGVASAQTTADAGVRRAEVAAGTAPAAPGATATAGSPAATPAATQQREGLNVNTLILGGSVALAGVGALFASLFGALTSLKGWAAIIGLILLVLATSALLGWLKLRKRDMSLLLEANGWAVNLQMKITRRVAPLFAYVPKLPKDAVIDRTDMLPAVPGEGRGRRIAIIVGLAVVVAGVLLFMMKRGMLR